MKILKWIGIIVGALLVIFLLLMFQPWVYLPHKHIEISLPFAPSDDATTGLIPMGEKIEHNESNGNPDGHPGIDFGFRKVTQILSASDGVVNSIGKNSEGTIDISVSSGFYKITYKELNTVESDLHFLSRVKKGQVLGTSGRSKLLTGKPEKSDGSGQVHWEFSSASMAIDRLCPVNYFDAESKARIEKIWANAPANDQFKKLYPDICSGVYKDKED